MASDTSSTRQNAPNFSRPQPQQSAMKSGKKPKPDRHVHIIDAFYDPTRDIPSSAGAGGAAAPRFSSDESSATSDFPSSSEHSVGSETPWDGQSGELGVDATFRKKRYDAQRSEAPHFSRTSTGSTVSSTVSSGLEIGLPPDAGAGRAASLVRPAEIVKRVSVDQRSERVASPPQPQQAWEDSESQHTVSEGSDGGSFDSQGRWQSSDYDTSSLSASEIRKLEKKGINPALYMEMQEAKKGKGKKWKPHLLGNGFVN